jgi:hypothetical protein
MTKSSFALGLGVVLLLIGAAGLCHGYLDGRWAPRPQLESIAKSLPQLPTEVGPWKMVSDLPLEPSTQRLLQCYGHINRQYQHELTGERVSVAVLFGPRGPIAVHTPEVCYRSAGTTQDGDRKKEELRVGDVADAFWKVRFKNQTDVSSSLEVWYGWSDGGAWQAANEPRFWMTDRLYKIQLSGPIGSAGSGSVCERFLRDFLPLLRRAVHGERSSSQKIAAIIPTTFAKNLHGCRILQPRFGARP